MDDATTEHLEAAPPEPVAPTELPPEYAGAYDAQARKLATMFRENFEQYRSAVAEDVAKAGPRT